MADLGNVWADRTVAGRADDGAKAVVEGIQNNQDRAAAAGVGQGLEPLFLALTVYFHAFEDTP